jgi:flagellar protein FliO/FliZ
VIHSLNVIRLPNLIRRLNVIRSMAFTNRLVFALAALAGGTTALAADPGRPFAAPAAVQSVTPPGVGSLGQVTLSLGLVLAIIFAAAWIVRRMRGFGRPASGALDVIANLPLGQKERAVLVRVGKQQILLGVAPGRINTLHVLPEPVELSTPPAAPASPGSPEKPTFKSLLMKSLGK